MGVLQLPLKNINIRKWTQWFLAKGLAWKSEPPNKETQWNYTTTCYRKVREWDTKPSKGIEFHEDGSIIRTKFD